MDNSAPPTSAVAVSSAEATSRSFLSESLSAATMTREAAAALSAPEGRAGRALAPAKALVGIGDRGRVRSRVRVEGRVGT